MANEVDHEALLGRLVPGDAESWEVLYAIKPSEAKIAAVGWGLFSLLFVGVGAAVLWIMGENGLFSRLDELSQNDLIGLGAVAFVTLVSLWSMKSSVGDLLFRPRVVKGPVEGVEEQHSRRPGKLYFLKARGRFWNITPMNLVERKKLHEGREVLIEATAGSGRVLTLLRRR